MGVILTPTFSPFQAPSFKVSLILFIYFKFFFSAALGLLKGRHRFPPAFSQVPMCLCFFYALET